MNKKELRAAIRAYRDAKEVAERLELLASGSHLDGDGRLLAMEAVVSLEGMAWLLRKVAREGVQ